MKHGIITERIKNMINKRQITYKSEEIMRYSIGINKDLYVSYAVCFGPEISFVIFDSYLTGILEQGISYVNMAGEYYNKDSFDFQGEWKNYIQECVK